MLGPQDFMHLPRLELGDFSNVSTHLGNDNEIMTLEYSSSMLFDLL